jgi:hypothetical protein
MPKKLNSVISRHRRLAGDAEKPCAFFPDSAGASARRPVTTNLWETSQWLFSFNKDAACNGLQPGLTASDSAGASARRPLTTNLSPSDAKNAQCSCGLYRTLACCAGFCFPDRRSPTEKPRAIFANVYAVCNGFQPGPQVPAPAPGSSCLSNQKILLSRLESVI